LRLWNGSISFQYWQKPGVARLTKVYIFNVTNTENFLQFNEKPKLQEIGPFVYREDMEKVNIVFHNNGTVSYQHKKILNFVPEMSKDENIKVIVPNIPLLRNGTLSEISTIFTGHTDMKEFGLINRLNGLDHLPYWPTAPCNSITASEGSFFPPRDRTGANIVHVWDKDFCRTLPLQYRGPVEKTSIKADLYTPPDVVFGLPNKTFRENECFCSDGIANCPPQGLQDISPCQYSAPVYLSFPHFYKADPKLLNAVDGLKPMENLHQTYFKIQPKLGVPIEAKARVQLNLKVERQRNIAVVKNFPDIVFPIMWIEEGVEELTPSMRRLIYLATTFADIAAPCVTYGMILVGLTVIITVFVKAYNSPVLTHEAIELGKRTIRRGSSFLITGQNRLLAGRDSYVLLNNIDLEEKQNMIEI
ncbi:Scavenger receptor class B member 1, partial [Camponotus floridanus]